jgi:hypothetical protein
LTAAVAVAAVARIPASRSRFAVAVPEKKSSASSRGVDVGGGVGGVGGGGSTKKYTDFEVRLDMRLLESLEDADGYSSWQLDTPLHVHAPKRLSPHDLALIRDVFGPFYEATRVRHAAGSDRVAVTLRSLDLDSRTEVETRRELERMFGPEAYDGWMEADIVTKPAADSALARQPPAPGIAYNLVYAYVDSRPIAAGLSPSPSPSPSHN